MAKQTKNKYTKLTETIYPIVERQLRERGHNPELAEIITLQLAYESGYGTEPTGKFNLGGIKHSGSRMKNYEYVIGPKDTERYTSFNSYDDMINFYLNNTEQKWGEALSASTMDDYIDTIHSVNNPKGMKYSTTPVDKYKATMRGMGSMAKAITEFKSNYNPDEYKNYIGDSELTREGKSKNITDESILREPGYTERPNSSKGKSTNSLEGDNPYIDRSFKPGMNLNQLGQLDHAYAASNNQEQEYEDVGIDYSGQVADNNSTKVNTKDLNFNYQPKNSASSLSFSKGKVPIQEEQKSPEQMEQVKALEKQREKEFNFTGTPSISKKKGLVDAVFEEGGSLTEFNEGGLHEENINGGIRQGINEQGTFNLVEEGETKYNDYIFSNKYFLNENDVTTARLDPKVIGMSVADASKHLNRFLDEAPFDKITRDTVNEQLDNLILLNEKFKADEEFRENLFKVPENQEELVLEEDGVTYQEPLPVDVENQDYQFNGGGGLSYSSALDDAIANGKFNPADPTGGLNNGLNSGLNQASGIITGATGLYGTLSDSLSTSGISTDGDSFTDPNSINQGKMGIQGALSGASAGAAIGSAVPVIGTAIGAVGGAVIGGIGGLIGGNQKRKKAEKSVRNYEYKQMNTELENEGIIFTGGGRLKGSRYRLEGSMIDEYNTLLEGIEKSGDEVDKDKIARIILTRNGKNPSDYLESHSSVYPGGTAAMHLNHRMVNYGNPNGDLGQLPYTNRSSIEDIKEPRGGGDIGGKPVAQQAVSYKPTIPSEEEVYHPSSFSPNASTAMTGAEGTRLYELGNYTPTEAELEFKKPTPEVPVFTPRKDYLGEILPFAPAVGSLFNVLNKEKPEYTSYQTNDFKYNPSYVDENRMMNPLKQDSANILRSLEQSGMSSGSMMAAKLATGANQVRGLSDAYAKMDDTNRAEDRLANEFSYRTSEGNTSIINQQIDTNMQNRAMADLQNKQSRNELFQNLGQVGIDRRNVNTARNMSRGYNQDGTFNPDSKGMLNDLLEYIKGQGTKEKGGTLFGESDQTTLIRGLLNLNR